MAASMQRAAVRSRLIDVQLRRGPDLLCSEEGDVGPGCELVQGLLGLELGQPDADANADCVLDRPIDQREALDHLREVDTRDTGDELVTAEANDRVEGTQMGTHDENDGRQDAIARDMTVTVIHDFQVIDVHERDNELPVHPPSSLNLVIQGELPHGPAICPGEFVEVCRVKLSL